MSDDLKFIDAFGLTVLVCLETVNQLFCEEFILAKFANKKKTRK